MSDLITVHSEDDIKRISMEHLRDHSYVFAQVFENFLYYQYGIGLKEFDKLVKQNIPEDFV